MANQRARRSRRNSWLPPLGLTAGIVLYALALAYFESAVVVYLRAALGVPTGSLFLIDLCPPPLHSAGSRRGGRGRPW